MASGSSPPFTISKTVRAPWWKRPINLVRGRPNRVTITYTDCRFKTGPTVRGETGDSVSVSVAFSTDGDPTIETYRW